MSFTELIEFIVEYVSNFRGQGRPLHHSFIYLLSFLGWNLNGLQGIYVIGFAIVSFNAILFFLLLHRIHGYQLAIVGALAFALYSADTTQAFLTHSLGLQTALTLFLLAAHSYISRRYFWAYALVLLSLLTYETLFLVFVPIPLLSHAWDKNLLKVMAKHIVILAILFVGVFIVRVGVGDLEATSLGNDASLSTSIKHMMQGPLWSIGAYLYRAIQTYRALDIYVIAAIGLSFPILLFVFYRWAIDRSGISAGTTESKNSRVWQSPSEQSDLKIFSLMSEERIKGPLKLAAIGAVMLLLAYPLTFTTEPDQIFGRATRNHFAAVIGSSLLVAALWIVATEFLRSEILRFSSSLVLAITFASMLGFGQVVQRDYARGWEYQREFWSDLLETAPDAKDGIAIIVDSSGIKESFHIGAMTWNMPRVLERIIEFPESWDIPPSAYKMNDGWLAYLHEAGGTLMLNHKVALTPRDHVREVASSDMILIITDDGGVARQNSPIVIGGIKYPLSVPSEPVLQNLPKKAFFDVLIPSDSP